ncbi:MAG: choice-of-anchor D domain-containing protein [Bradymonadia bacterium]
MVSTPVITALCATAFTGCLDSGGSNSTSLPPWEGGGGVPLPAISVSVGRLDFGGVQAGQSRSRTFSITNPGIDPLVIDDLTFDGVSDFDLTINGVRLQDEPERLGDLDGDGIPGLASGEQVELRLTFTAGELGQQLGLMVIDSNARLTPRVEIDLVARAIPPTCLTVTPPALDFGTVPVQQAVEQEIVLDTCTSGLVQVESTRLDPGSSEAFEIIPLATPARVKPERRFSVRFQPQAIGPVNGTAVVVSDDPNTPTWNIPITGSGEGNQCPVASVPAFEQVVLAEEPLFLDGSLAFDPDGVDGLPQRWRWRMLTASRDADAIISEDPEGLEPDDLSTPGAWAVFPEAARYRMVLEVFDEESGPPVDFFNGPDDPLGTWVVCDSAQANLIVLAQPNPLPGLGVEVTWATPGLPDIRRPNGTVVDLHLRRPGATEWFQGSGTCRPDSCEHDWGAPGFELDDPTIRQGMQTAFQYIEIIEPETTPFGQSFDVGLRYRRRFDDDGYDFGPTYAAITVSFRGFPVWSSLDTFGPIELVDEGDFVPLIEITWPSQLIRPFE